MLPSKYHLGDLLRIHVIPLGFTPEVFTNSYGPLMKNGADKIITVHTPVSDRAIKEKVEKTFEAVKKAVHGIEIEQLYYTEDTFMDYVKTFIKLFNRFGDGDEIYVHIGGGERHIGLALVYASFFSKKNIMLIPILEYGTDAAHYKYEVVSSLVPIELTDVQKDVLRLVSEKPSQRLRDLATRQKPDNPESAAPSLLRHLRNLVQYRLVTLNKTSNTYTATETASLFLH